jgi:hypothetical protein
MKHKTYVKALTAKGDFLKECLIRDNIWNNMARRYSLRMARKAILWQKSLISQNQKWPTSQD